MKIYINGEPQATDVHADTPEAVDPHRRVPLKVGQRHTRPGSTTRSIHTVAHLRSGPLAGEVGHARRYDHAPPTSSAKPAEKRPGEEHDAVFAWWRGVDRPGFARSCMSKSGPPRSGRGRDQAARHRLRT